MIRFGIAFWTIFYINVGFSSPNNIDVAVQYLKDEKCDKALHELNSKTLANTPDIQYLRAFMHYDGICVKRDYSKSIDAFAAEAKNGDVDAQAALGIIFLYGGYEIADYDKALELNSIAAKKKHATATIALAMMYAQGRGVNNDYVKINELLTPLAFDENDAEAQYFLASLYLHGWSVKQDIKKAVELLKESALSGQGCSAAVLSRLYDEGDILKKDAVKAEYWWNEKKKSGCESASTPGPIIRKRISIIFRKKFGLYPDDT